MKTKNPDTNTSKFKIIWRIVLLLSFVFPLIINLKIIFGGTFPFWYDPARDMLLGLENLKKITLIGPPSGIPGIFYGPYWIWLISLAELISKDPRIVAFLIATVPYFTLFPYVLYKLSSVLTKRIALMVWLAFILTTSYSSRIWNPYPAPLIYLSYLALIISIDFNSFDKVNLVKILASGIVAGLLVNFHISFGIAILTSSFIYLTFEFLLNFKLYGKSLLNSLKNRLVVFILFSLGVFIVYLPFLVFESRHGFNQIKSLTFTLQQAIIHHSSVVGQIGLSKEQIIQNFLNRLDEIFRLPVSSYIILLLLSFASLIYIAIKKFKLKLDRNEVNFLSVLIINHLVVVYIFLTSKNPIWGYHFMGVDMIQLLLLGFLAKKLPIVNIGLFLGTVWIAWMSIIGFSKSFVTKITYSCFITEDKIVQTTYKDANHSHFNLFVYNPGIYTYDYDYLFQWEGKKYGYIPKTNRMVDPKQPAYLIMPKIDKPGIKEDFIDYRTPIKIYKTVKKWENADGTVILKRVKR